MERLLVGSPAVAMRMRQRLAQLERQFVEESAADRERRESLYREAEQRSRRRHRERDAKRGSLVAMFRTLYIVMG